VHLQQRSHGQQEWAHALALQQQHGYMTLLDMQVPYRGLPVDHNRGVSS
jgi:hypothetical protein